MNDKFVQVKGPFSAHEDVVSYIKANYYPDIRYIKKCGIHSSKIGNYLNINGNVLMIGKPEILEFNDVKIYSLYFLQDEKESTCVDCILE